MYKTREYSIKVQNVPDYADGSKHGFMVVTIQDNSIYWFYGLYDTFVQACDVAEIIGGFVVEVNNDNPGEEN